MSIIKSLKKAVKAERNPGIVAHTKFTDSVVAADSQLVEDNRNTEWPLHVSSVIADYCVRKLYIMLNTDKVFHKRVDPAMHIVWAMGKAAEHHFVSQHIKTVGTHNVYGRWLCKCERQETFGLGRKTHFTTCPNCQSSIYSQYKEIELLYDGLLVGRPDCLSFLAPHNTLTLLETKSKTGDMFKALKQPDPDHIMQAYSYHKILIHNIERFRSQGIELNQKTFHIQYINKNYSFDRNPNGVYKEFVINVNDLGKSYDQVFETTVKDLTLLNRATKIPKRIVCSSQTDKCAKSCPVSHQCFSWGD